MIRLTNGWKILTAGILGVLLTGVSFSGDSKLLLTDEHGAVTYYRIQCGNYPDEGKARSWMVQAANRGLSDIQLEPINGQYKVFLGNFGDYGVARDSAKVLRQDDLFQGCFVGSKVLQPMDAGNSGWTVESTLYDQVYAQSLVTADESAEVLWDRVMVNWKRDLPLTPVIQDLVGIIKAYPKDAHAATALYHLGCIYSSLAYKEKQAGGDPLQQQRYLISAVKLLEQYLQQSVDTSEIGKAYWQLAKSDYALSKFRGDRPQLMQKSIVNIDQYLLQSDLPDTQAEARLFQCGGFLEQARDGVLSYQTAIQKIIDTEKAFPQAPDKTRARLGLMHAEAIAECGGCIAAEDIASQVYSLASTLPSEQLAAEFLMGYCRLQNGDYAHAEKYLTQVLSETSTIGSDPEVLPIVRQAELNQGWCLYKEGRATEALTILKAVASKYKGNWESDKAQECVQAIIRERE